ncbi:kelch-like protein 10 [Paramormyrops kingsleyae]|uniref:kelch-like protein 10 n=1 Tax=Paramormyrops kingsleyae TaxID=1676925 RepID=UPI003B96F83F
MMTLLFNIFKKLWLVGALCDVVLVADGVKFKAHKIILRACSPYFRALFASRRNIKRKDEYMIPDVSPEAMRLVIEYAYTHYVLVTVDNVESLLAAADQLNIPGVVQCCSDFLMDQLCLENCVGIYSIAYIYFCPELRQAAFIFIMQNFKEVASTSEEFLELTLHQLSDIIEKDELNVRDEDVVFEAILRWIMHEPATRKAHISVLLPKVRLARMKADYLMKTVKNNGLVKASAECRLIISEALKAMCDGPPNSDFQSPLLRPRLPYEILLAIGGWTDHQSNKIEAYDTRADRWVDVTQPSEIPWAYHGAVYLKGFVYCIGGSEPILSSSRMQKFDLIARTWHQVAPMHSCRSSVSVIVLSDFIYAMGGCDGPTDLSTAERYNPETNTWSFIQPMNQPRMAASATTLNGKIYICGGCNRTGSLSSAECYDPVTDGWTMICPMTSPRCGVGVAAYKGKIYAVGGLNKSVCLQTVEAYDPVTNQWHAVALLSAPCAYFGIEVVDDLLVVVGGGYSSGNTTRVECFDAETGSWYHAQDMGTSRRGLSCVVVPALPSIRQYAAPGERLMATPEALHPLASSTMPSG